MKRRITACFIVISLFFLLFQPNTFALDSTADFNYTVLEDGTLEITKYVGTDSDIIIPDSLNGKKVTSIGSYFCYYSSSDIKNVSISEGIVKIGEAAFWRSSLQSIVIPKSLSSIGRMCFFDLVQLNINYCGSRERWSLISFGESWAKYTRINFTYEYNRTNYELPIDSAGRTLSIGDTFEMGRYPQTRITDSNLLNNLNSIPLSMHNYGYQYVDSDENYFDLGMQYADVVIDGQKYRKVYFTEYRPFWPFKDPTEEYSLQDDYGYYVNHTYWFRWDPIVWRVLDVKGDGVYAISQSILDSMPYNSFDKETVSWKTSTLNNWLNTNFKEHAFSTHERNNLDADVLLLKQYASSSDRNYYLDNFKNLENKQAVPTSYAESQGSSYYYWLFDSGVMSNSFGSIAPDGTSGISYCDRTDIGVRPVIVINLSTVLSSSDPPENNDDRLTEICFYNGPNLTCYVGESSGTLFILDSNITNISDISFQSSDTSVVYIDTISIGEGQYITQGNEQIATVYLNCKKEGTATITATAPDGSTATLNISVIEKPDPLENKEGFKPYKDGWGFVNHYYGFDYLLPTSNTPDKDYRIPAERYAEVFGKSYVATAAANGKVFSSMVPVWGGNCYGMCAAADLFYLDKLNWQDYANPIDSTIFGSIQYPNHYCSEIKFNNERVYAASSKNSEITKLIERYQIFQYGSSHGFLETEYSTFGEIENHFYRKISQTDEIYEHISDGDYIQNLYNMATSTKEPILVTLDGKNGCHEIILCNKAAATYTGNGWYSFPVYDPNSPYAPDIFGLGSQPDTYYLDSHDKSLYLELNPSQNKWRYNGDTLATGNTYYYGCDSTGTVIYNEIEDGGRVTTRHPDQLIFLRIYNTDYPTEFHGDTPWKVKNDTDTLIFILPDTSLEITTVDGQPICSVSNGKIIQKTNGVEFQKNLGYIGTLDASCGKLAIPYKQFNIVYTAGDNITMVDDDSAINLSCDNKSTIITNMNNNSITVSGDDMNNVVAQITEVLDSDEYTSVSIDGTLGTNDAITLSLEDSELNIKNQITHDGIVDVYTDNENQNEEQYIQTLSKKENAGDTSVENVREITKLGDVDGDGTVTIVDATLVQMFAAEFIDLTDLRQKAADANHDGKVDVTDATLIQMYAAEFIDHF